MVNVLGGTRLFCPATGFTLLYHWLVATPLGAWPWGCIDFTATRGTVPLFCLPNQYYRKFFWGEMFSFLEIFPTFPDSFPSRNVPTRISKPWRLKSGASEPNQVSFKPFYLFYLNIINLCSPLIEQETDHSSMRSKVKQHSQGKAKNPECLLFPQTEIQSVFSV